MWSVYRLAGRFPDGERGQAYNGRVVRWCSSAVGGWRLRWLLAGLWLGFGGVAQAEGHGGERSGGLRPAGAASAEVLAEGTPVYAAPTTAARRRGTVRRGTRLPWLGTARDGSGVLWVRVGEALWVEARHVRRRELPPAPAPVARAVRRPGALLPRPYAFVAFDATPVYRTPSDVLAGVEPVASLGRGFGVVVRALTEVDGVPLARLRAGWVELDALAPARPSRFRGVQLRAAEDLASLAWADPRRGAIRFEGPGGRQTGRIAPRKLLRVAEARGPWLRLDEGGWVRRREVVQPALPTQWPEGLGVPERWVLVDTRGQWLIAFEGRTPRFVTLVSTGRPATPTPPGEHRIWVKLAADDMDDLERDDVVQNYAIEDVPWVQYFAGGNGFHAAFWHDRFGTPHSHGCVNLSPADARWLFEFTEPKLPEGWSAVLPARPEDATRVIVR